MTVQVLRDSLKKSGIPDNMYSLLTGGLPSAFREWLKLSDGGECFPPAGVQFYGVAHEPLIEIGENGYLMIGMLASGDPVVAEQGTEKVAVYNQEAGRIESDEEYKDFFSFLEDLPDILGIGEA